MIRRLLLLCLLASSAFAQSHQYWRLNGVSANLMSIGNVVFYDSGGSVISFAGGTASASSVGFGEVASNAFLGNTDCSTFWLANSASAWLEMAFTGSVAVDHVGVTIGCNGGRGFAISVQLQRSDDNSTWATQNEWDGLDSNDTTTTVNLTPANARPPSPGIYWRLSFTASGTSCVGMSAVKFFTGANAGGSQITTAPYAAKASSAFNDATAPYSAITLNTEGSGWQSAAVGGTYTWAYVFPTVQSVGSVQFSNASIGGCGQVNNLAVAYSLDGANYTTGANTFTPTWAGQQTKTFNITGGPSGFTPQVSPFLVGP